MKILMLFLICLIILGPTLAENSYAQTTAATKNGDSKVTGATEPEDFKATGAQKAQKPLKVYLQLQIRNSDGKLLAYFEPTVLYIYHPALIDQYLDTKPKSIITKDGERFEQIHFKESGTFGTYHAMAQYRMMYSVDDTPVSLLTLVHDGYYVLPRDTFTASWTVIRSAR